MRRKRTRYGALAIMGLAATQSQAALFFSEYIEGSSNNKALEIYNNGPDPVDLGTAGANVQVFFNGSASAGLTINLMGTVAPNDVFVLAQSSANAAILAQADQTNGAGWFNGDDAVVLRLGSTIIDRIGQVGVDPGAEWGTGLLSTADNTLRRKFAITGGDVNAGDPFDPATEWDGFATDTVDGLGAHSGATPPPPPPPPGPFTGSLFINEVDYDQPSIDTAEFIELAGLAGTYENVTILLINGANNTIYQTINLPSFTLADETDGFGFYVLSGNAANVPNTDLDLSPDTDLIQNGAPDAIALLINGELIHYLSYEGDTTLLVDGSLPNDGGSGLEDDPGAAFAGYSLQKVGTGDNFDDFTFDFFSRTPGAVNNRQFFATAAIVPEPATFGMLGVAGLMVAGRRRRRA